MTGKIIDLGQRAWSKFVDQPMYSKLYVFALFPLIVLMVYTSSFERDQQSSFATLLVWVSIASYAVGFAMFSLPILQRFFR